MGLLYKINNLISDCSRSVLSDKTIVKYYKKGLLIESPLLNSSQIQPNSVDLTLGESFKKILSNDIMSDSYVGQLFTRDQIAFINPSKPIKYESGESKEFIIQPGEFLLLASCEVLNIPNGIISFVQGRSSIARIGIQTEQAGLIDSGFRGTITFEVYNETNYPIKLYSGMRIAQVYFFKSQYSNKVYGIEKRSKYFNQMDATGSKINNDPELYKYNR